MLSNPINHTPSSALQARQRLHRRQKSVPVAAFEAMKMTTASAPTSAPPATAMQQRQQQMQQQQSQQRQQQPPQTPSRQPSHRRGQSLDTRRQQLLQRQQKQQQQQHKLMAAAASARTADTNQGLSTQQQHVMRETQQQCTVRPGSLAQPSAQQSRGETLDSTQQQNQQQQQQLQQQQQQQRQQQDCSAASFDFYNGPTAAMMRKTLSGGGLPAHQSDFQLFASPDPQSLQSPDTFINFSDAANGPAFAAPSPQGWASEEETSSTRHASRRVSNGIMDRVAKFEGMSTDGMQRPATPPRQNVNTYFPPTPTETPLDRMEKHPGAPRLDRFSEGYDESMEETIKPLRNRGHRGPQPNRSSGVFEDMRQQVDAMAMATPPRSDLVQMPMTPAEFLTMNNMNTEFLKMQNGNFVAIPIPADMQHLSPPQSQHPTPATAQGVFDSSNDNGSSSNNMNNNTIANPNVFDGKPELWPTEYSPYVAGAVMSSPVFAAAAQAAPSTPSRRLAAHTRNESMASIASAASIASINIDETRTETGVTLDDIAAYIDGPSPTDGKWRCLYEGCDKRFGRKENIKSHVQTHLNDRQYQCPHCQKCFVRQHDLKRHAKIHTGIKPYPCECGNNFARHDALTRHRQRGMCIGAFDGAVRKIGKRGRPRKSRPSIDERRDKTTRTRSKNKSLGNNGPETSPGASSYSGYSGFSDHSDHSDPSAANSPQTDDAGSPLHDELDLELGPEPNQEHERDAGPQFFDGLDDDMLDMGFGLAPSSSRSTTMNPSALTVSSAPMPGARPSAMRRAPPRTTTAMVAAMTTTAPAAVSPSAMSHYSHTSHASHTSLAADNSSNDTIRAGAGDDLLLSSASNNAHNQVSHPASPAKSVASHYTQHPGTPPELSASSSPPPSASQFFVLDPNTGCSEEDAVGLSAPLTSGCGTLGMGMSVGVGMGMGGGMGMTMGAGMTMGGVMGTMGAHGLPPNALDDDMMKAFAGDDVLVPLDNSGLSMLGASKYDDEYGMFGSDDVFFGSS